MKQSALFKDVAPQDANIKPIGHRLYLKFSDSIPAKAALYHNNALAAALGITRQTVHNYIEIKKYFGLEGLIHNYSPSRSKSLREQRRRHSSRRSTGNKARQVEQIHKQQRDAGSMQLDLPLATVSVPAEDQPFSEEHDWKATRYAGVFMDLITLIT